MKKVSGAAALLVLVVSGLWSQPTLRVLTNPRIPPREVLERLDLTVAWTARLPTAGQRDGLFIPQLISAKNRVQLAVQTIFGTVFLLDAETGDLLWNTRVGIPGWSGQPVGHNERSVFVTRTNLLYVLNRATGAHRYYTIDKDTKLPDYGFVLPAAPSAAPQADEAMLYVCMGNRVEAFLLPDWDAAEGSIKTADGQDLSPQDRQAIKEKTSALPPLRAWSHQEGDSNLEQPVLMNMDHVTAVTVNGNVISLNKFERQPPFEFKTSGSVVAPMGQHGPMAYVGSVDHLLYAFNVASQRLAWRFFASAPILVKPEVTDRDVFVSGHGQGLYRVERDTGRAVWLNKQADRFLSTNQKFVYARDRNGVLLVLDYERGTALGQFDTRDWLMAVPNDMTDRFYLANHDGQIVCLRNRAEKVPVRARNYAITPLQNPKQDAKKEDPKAS